MTNKDFEFITDKIGIWFANLKLKSFRHTFDGDIYPSSALVTDYELFIAKFKKDIKFNKDTILEEPVFKVGDTIQKKDNNSIRYSIINKTSDGYRALRGLSDTIVIWFSEQDQWELVEEPVSEELEEAAIEYEEKGRIDSVISRKRDFINGAKWQKQQMMKGAIDAKVGLTT